MTFRDRAGARLAVPVIVGGLLVLAAWLRLIGLSYGLPAVYNPDEVAILSRALAFATGDLNPHNFLYPTFYFYVLSAWIGVYFVAARLAGAVPSLRAFETLYFVDPSSIYLAGRVLSLVCGVLSVLALWWLTRRLFGTRVATIAALFLAVAPTAVRDAHYIKHDVPVTLTILMSMIAISRLWPGGARAASTPRLLIAGAACGLSFSIHYYAVFLIAPLAIAVVLATRGLATRARLTALVLSGAAMLVTFLALSPFLLAEPGIAWRDIVANRAIVIDRSGALGGRWLPSGLAYLRMLWQEAVGWPVALLAAWGAWVALRLSKSMALWLMMFPTLFFLFISNTVAASRYLNPVLPFLCMAGALGLSDLVARFGPRRRVVGMAILAVAAAIPALMASYRLGMFFREPDTRTLTQRYIESHIPPGLTILVQPYSVQLVQSREGLVEALSARIGDPSAASTKFARRLQLDPWPAPAYRTLYLGEGGLDADKIYVGYGAFRGGNAADVFAHLGVDYVVLKRYPVDDSATEPLLVALTREGRLMTRFSPYRPGAPSAGKGAAAPFLHNTDTPLVPALAQPGPIMEIWAVR